MEHNPVEKTCDTCGETSEAVFTTCGCDADDTFAALSKVIHENQLLQQLLSMYKKGVAEADAKRDGTEYFWKYPEDIVPVQWNSELDSWVYGSKCIPTYEITRLYPIPFDDQEEIDQS